MAEKRDQSDPLISIIVPVYKAEAYITQCISSILDQTVESFELLLIDDGSPDSCPLLCDQFAAKDSRIRVIHQTNAGVSAARNSGLDEAKGTFIVFIDSDDHVDRKYLEILLEAYRSADKPGNVVVYTDYLPFTQDGAAKRSFPDPFAVDFSNPDPAYKKAFHALVFGTRVFPPYCKLFCRELIEANGLRFNTQLKSAEDFDFNLRYLKHVDVINYVPSSTYHYRIGYKRYIPSNAGILGDSEIQSAHIMVNGITDLARRMGVYEEVKTDIFRWAARKHYYNRLPMLFLENREIDKKERKELYERLVDDQAYRKACKAGIKLMQDSTLKKIGCYADCFEIWYWYYRLRNNKERSCFK